MFSKKQRFKFDSKLPKQSISSESFNLRYKKNDGQGLKVAVVVSKRIDKRAVVRNSIKREILDIVAQKVNIEDNLSLVFYSRKQTEKPILAKEIEEALNKIKNGNF